MAVQNDFSTQFLFVSDDLIMLDHDHHEIHCVKESIQVVILILHNVFFNIRIIYLQARRQMTFLALEKLKCRGFPHVVDVFLVSETIKADSGDIGHRENGAPRVQIR